MTAVAVKIAEMPEPASSRLSMAPEAPLLR